MSKTFCPLPWIHLATRPNGDVRVCCTANASGAGKTDEKEAGLVKEDGVAMNLRQCPQMRSSLCRQDYK